MDRDRPVDVINIFRLEVLHTDGKRNTPVKCFADGKTCLLFENGPQNIEVPIVVVPECPGRMTSALWAYLDHVLSFEIHRGVDPSTCSKKVHDPGLFFVFRE